MPGPPIPSSASSRRFRPSRKQSRQHLRLTWRDFDRFQAPSKHGFEFPLSLGRYPLSATRVRCFVRIDPGRHRIAAVPMVGWNTRPIAIGRIGAGVAVAILAACGGAHPSSTTYALVSLPTSADAFAQRVLAQAPIPPGARATAAVHSDFLKEPFETVGADGLIDVSRIYVIDELPGAVLSYVTTHLPQGARTTGTTTLGSRTAEAYGIAVSMPTSGANENYAELLYTVAADRAGSSEFRVDAQVIWVPNRSADELAPAGVTVEVTGFSQTSVMNESSGPVTIKLTSAQADALRTVANSMPLAPLPSCMEDSLLYKVDFHPSASPNQSFELDGYECVATVLVTSNGKALSPLNDAGCHLLATVVSLLPKGQADGTRSALALLCP